MTSYTTWWDTIVWKAAAVAALLVGFGSVAIAQEDETEGVTTQMSEDEADAMAAELDAAADAPAATGDVANAAPVGQWKRKNGDTVDVSLQDDQLFCTITEGKRVGFEMCHGMTLRDDGTWKGKNMKHPGMPGFMTFNGTVTVDGDSLSIKGCAVKVCDSETWTKITN